MPNYRTSIIKALARLGSNGTINPDALDNQGALLGPVYLWQVVQDIAKDREKEAWRALEKEELILSDEALRANVTGETILTKTPSFALQVRVTSPRETFDKDAFIAAVASRFKIDKHKLVELAMTSIKYSRPPLTKKVIEL